MPLEQISNALTFYAFFVAAKVGKTGLTVTVDVWRVDNAGAATEVVTAAAATEIGDGVYRYILAAGSVTVEGEYIAVFKTTDASVDLQHIATIWVVGSGGLENLDAAISSRAASGAGVVTLISPVALGGDLSIVRGDDYNNTDGRALEWSTTDASTWPDLTGAAILFTAKNSSGGTLVKAGIVVTPTGATKKVRVELTAAETGALVTGKNAYAFDVQATLQGSSRKVTLVRASMTVLVDYAA